MPIIVRWLIADHVILLENSGNITVEDLDLTDATVLPMLEGSSKPLVHIVVDDRKQLSIPSLKDMSKIKYVRHPRTGWIISQEKNPITRMIGAMVGSMVKIRFRYVDNINSGLKFLSEIDSTLPDAMQLRRYLDEIESSDNTVG